MGLMDFFGKPKRAVTARTAVLLTDAGKRAAETQMYTGRNYAILAALQDHHMSKTVGDIANETDIDVSEVKERVKVLARQGQVRLMSEYEVD
jgi:DNA-binding MarR family transcriptional regulator